MTTLALSAGADLVVDSPPFCSAVWLRGRLPVIDALIERLGRFRDDRDWAQFHTPKDLAVSVSIEAGELLEIFQWRPADQPLNDDDRRAAEDEVADVFIYLLMLAEQLDIDLLDAAHRKVEANEQRFPVTRALGIAKPPKV